MKIKKIFYAVALISISLNVFAFRTENRTDHIIDVFDGTWGHHDEERYHETVHSHQSSHGWNINANTLICVEWDNVKFPADRSCCIVRPHRIQIVTGDPKHGINAHCD